jgi:hypothetical protein
LIDDVDNLVRALGTSTVFIAGLQQLRGFEFETLLGSGFECKENFIAGYPINAAAIWLYNGRIERYLQFKRNPATPEPNMVRGTNIYVFESRKASGRLTFAIAICADMLNDERIDDFRVAIGQHCPLLDFAFVPLRNPKQEHEEVKDGLKRFFQPASLGRVVTKLSALVYVNEPARGDKEEFGRSFIAFDYSLPANSNDSNGTFEVAIGSGYKSARFREDKQGLWSVTFKVIKMRHYGPGHGEARVISRAEHAANITEPLVFRVPSEVALWLIQTWRTRFGDFYLDLMQQASPKLAAEARKAFELGLTKASRDLIALWEKSIGMDDQLDRQTMRLFSMRTKESPRPGTWGLEKEVASLLWCHLLITLGAERNLLVEQNLPVHLQSSDWLVVFLCVGPRSWRDAVAQYRADHNHLPSDRLCLIVVVCLEGDPPWNERLANSDYARADADEDATDVGVGMASRFVCTAVNQIAEQLFQSRCFDDGVAAVASKASELFANR